MKNNRVRQLTYIAINVSMVTLFLLLSNFIYFFLFAINLFLPLSSALIKLRINAKYTFVYFISIFLISLLINFQDTLFFIIPSSIAGIIFGYLIDKKIHAFYMILITSLVNISLSYFSIIMIDFIYNIDFIKSLYTIFNIDSYTFNTILPIGLFFISITQMLLTYFVIEEELKKFSFFVDESFSIFKSLPIILLLIILLTFIFYFINEPIYLLLSGLALVCSSYLFLYNSKINSQLVKCLFIVTFSISSLLILVLISYQGIIKLPLFLIIIYGIIDINSIGYLLYYKIKKITVSEDLFNKC